ncbi:hypothetical protein Tco_1362535 [Tanacetum coccineum]
MRDGDEDEDEDEKSDGINYEMLQERFIEKVVHVLRSPVDLLLCPLEKTKSKVVDLLRLFQIKGSKCRGYGSGILHLAGRLAPLEYNFDGSLRLLLLLPTSVIRDKQVVTELRNNLLLQSQSSDWSHYRGCYHGVIPARERRRTQEQLCSNKIRVIQEVKALDASSGDKDSSGIVSDKENDLNDTDIRPSYDTEPLAEVPYTAKYNVFAVESQHYKKLENMNDTSLMVKVDSNTTPNSSDMCNNEFKDDHNADNHEDEHVVLADLIANLNFNIDENKKIQKQLRNANA